MSTNGMTNWAVDLKDVGAIYPFQGWEWLMVILCVIFWLAFHYLQIRNEEREIASEAAADPRGEATKKAIEDY